MSKLKYILLIVTLFLLWMTEPLWRTVDTTISPIDILVKEQQDARGELLAAEAEKLKNLEAKFGKKPSASHHSGVPFAVEEYWNKTLQYPDSLEEEICGPIRAGNDGWTTVCRYRTKDGSGALQLKQDTYIIKNGIAHK